MAARSRRPDRRRTNATTRAVTATASTAPTGVWGHRTEPAGTWASRCATAATQVHGQPPAVATCAARPGATGASSTTTTPSTVATGTAGAASRFAGTAARLI